MVDTLKLTLRIEMSMNINGLIYFLKRVPLIKRFFKKVGYEHNTVAGGFVTVSIIYEIIKMIFKVGGLLLFGILLPLIFVKYQYNNVQIQDTYNHLYLSFYILLPFIIDRILDPSPRKFICVKVMRMSAKNFMLADYLPQDILRFLIEIIMYYFVAKGFHLNMILVLLLVMAKHFYSIAYEALHVVLYHRTNQFLHKKIAFVSIYMLVFLAVGYTFSLLNLVLNIPDIIMVIIAIMGIVAGLLGGNYLLSYPYYDLAFNEANVMSELSIDKGRVKAEANFRTVKLNEKDYVKGDLLSSSYNHKSGYEYLNSIFFERHRRVLLRPIIRQLVIIAVILIACIVTVLLSKEAKAGFVEGILAQFPAVIFISYMMSTGPKATKAMFYNCDISLLRYGFYRENGAVLTTFTLRAKKVIGSNLIPAAFISVGLYILELLTGASGQKLLPVALLVITMTIFFSVHNMVLYYLLQPYSTDLSVKSPLFTVINAITYILSYLCLQMKTAPENFLFYTVLGTAIYIVIALIMVYKFAPRTFTIK